jgi:hypothetical protein
MLIDFWIRLRGPRDGPSYGPNPRPEQGARLMGPVKMVMLGLSCSLKFNDLNTNEMIVLGEKSLFTPLEIIEATRALVPIISPYLNYL